MQVESGRRALAGAALLVLGLVLGGSLLGLGFVRPVVLQDPVPVGAEGIVEAEQADETFALYTSDPESLAEGCRVTTANGRALAVVRAPSTEQMAVRDQVLHKRARFTALTPGRMTIVCPNPAGTFVGLDDPTGRNTAAIVAGAVLGGSLMSAGLVLLITAVRALRSSVASTP